ncbi:MAG: acetyl-CoA carboxylase biotin carboxyl carrier protein [Sandaracinaceae bacterium]|nr:acetyl-CoA carboxylase biotin carboxyl carrier protein [Sandaracinaceae bacterium]
MNIDLKQLRELMRAMKQADIHELEIEQEGERVLLRRNAAGATAVAPNAMMPGGMMPGAMMPSGMTGSMPPPPSLPAMSYDRPAMPETDPLEDINVAFITSPFVGTFYRSPSPDSPPFVEAGAEIRPGQVICIVEAMKLMNEIEAEVSGTVLEILVENGKPVEFGDRLFKIRKSG